MIVGRKYEEANERIRREDEYCGYGGQSAHTSINSWFAKIDKRGGPGSTEIQFMKRMTEWIPLACLGLTILVMHLFHHDRNYQLSDAAFYMERAQDMYITYREQGLLEGLRFQYLDRHWKPVLGQHLLLPVLAATGGDTRDAFDFYSVAMALFLASGIYFALSGWMRDRLIAAMGSLLIMLTPWVLSDQFEFGSEAPWLAFAAWFFGFLNRGSLGWATAALVLATYCRPVENVICLVIPFALFLFPRKWLWPLVEAAVILAITVYPYVYLKAEYPRPLMFSFVGLWLVYAIFKWAWLRRHPNREYVRAQMLWTSLLTAVFLFFLPSVFNMVDWSWRSAKGPLVDRVNYPGQERKSFLVFAVLSAGVWLNLPGLAILLRPKAVVEFWSLRKGALFIGAWGSFALAILVFFASGSREIRYYHLSWMVLAMLLFAGFAAAVEGRRIWPHFALALLLAVQAYAALPPHYLKKRSDFQNWTLWYPLAKLAGDTGHFRNLNLDTQFFEFFDYLKGLPIADDAWIMFIRRDTSPKAHFTMNPWRYSIRAREQGLHWRTVPYFRRTDGRLDIEALLQKAHGDAQYFVVGPPLTTPEEESVPPKDQEEMLVSRALFECYPGSCVQFGFEVLGEHQFAADDENPAQKFLIFRGVPRPQPN